MTSLEKLKKFIADKKANEKEERQKRTYERMIENEIDYTETKLELKRMFAY